MLGSVLAQIRVEWLNLKSELDNFPLTRVKPH